MSEKVVKLKIADLKPGMRIGKTIINHVDGKVLIKKGEPLSNTQIKALQIYFETMKHVKIKTVDEDAIFEINGESHYLPPKASKYVGKAVSIESQREAFSVVNSVINDIRVGGSVNTQAAEKAVTNIIDDVLGSEDAALNLLNIKDFDDYTYTHSVNVSTISVLIGTKLGIPKEDLVQLGVGGMMHDLGKIRIPLSILNKSGKLTDEEFTIMKKHPVFTYDILKDKGDISDIAKYIASQHHEKYNGSGYPNKLKKDEINYYARIVAISDVYDALTTDRIYRKAMMPYEAMKIIVSGSGTHFDPELVKVFLQALSIYPVGSYVLLNTGEIAVIKKVNTKQIIRPEIIIVKEKSGKKIEPVEINLIEDKTRFIKGAVVIDE